MDKNMGIYNAKNQQNVGFMANLQWIFIYKYYRQPSANYSYMLFVIVGNKSCYCDKIGFYHFSQK